MTNDEIRIDTSNSRAIRVLIFFGTLLLLLAFFKGDGGYHDLVYYLDDAEGLWLRGDMSRPGEVDETEMPDGLVVRRPVYTQYSLGLAFVSGPFVFFGHFLQWIFGGRIGARNVIVLMIPIISALSALLLYETGLLLGARARPSLWAAILFAGGTPVLTFSRLFYTEAAVIFFLMLAIWAFLRAISVSPLYPATSLLWAVFAGVGLAGAGACHYAEAFIVAALFAGMALRFLLGAHHPAKPTLTSRMLHVFALGTIPFAAVATILLVNFLRRGGVADTGYGTDVAALSLQHLGYNVRYLFYSIESGLKLGLLIRSPWIPFALLALLFWRPRPMSNTLRFALVTGALLQIGFWMCYEMLGFSPLRYFQPVTGALAVGLVCLGQKLDSIFPRAGLYVSGAVLLAFNAYWFILGDDHNRPILSSPNPADSGSWLIYTWYMKPFPPEMSDGYGMPPGALQWIVLASCIAGAAWCFGVAWRLIVNQELRAKS